MKKLFSLILVFKFCVSVGQVGLSNGLVACYAFNGNASEPINNLTGTLSAVTPTVDRFNTYSGALYFDGSAYSHVELPDDTLLKPQVLSFSAWIKGLPGNFPDPWVLYTAGSYSSTSEAYSLAFVNVTGGKKFRVRKSSGGVTNGVATTSVLSNNTWYHVCFTMDTSAIKLYLNGNMQGSVTCTIPFSYALGKNVFLGSSNEANLHQPFAGLMDNVRFYNRVLSPAEVTSLYILNPACITATIPPIAAIETADSIYCSGTGIQFLDKSLNYPTNWVWSAPGAISNNVLTANPSFTFNVAGNYTVTLNASNQFGTSTSTLAISIHATPTISAVVNPTLICKHDGGTITATGASSFTMFPGNILGSPAFINPLSPTIYTVTGTDSLGCVGSHTVLARVVICDFWPPTSVKESQNSDRIKVFPNPFHNTFWLISESNNVEYYHLYSYTGIEICSGIVEPAQKAEIDLSSVTKGIYFLVISKRNGKQTIKLIKE